MKKSKLVLIFVLSIFMGAMVTPTKRFRVELNHQWSSCTFFINSYSAFSILFTYNYKYACFVI